MPRLTSWVEALNGMARPLRYSPPLLQCWACVRPQLGFWNDISDRQVASLRLAPIWQPVLFLFIFFSVPLLSIFDINTSSPRALEPVPVVPVLFAIGSIVITGVQFLRITFDCARCFWVINSQFCTVWRGSPAVLVSIEEGPAWHAS